MIAKKFPLRTAVVDDEPTQLKIVSSFLEKDDRVEIYPFTDPADALEKVRTGTIDIVVTDLLMPGMLGDSLLREVKDLRLGVEVILFSKKILEAHMCFLDGARDVLQKPVDPTQLTASIDRCVAHFERWNQVIQEVRSS